MSRWDRYWFAEGGRTGIAIVRIAVACAVMGTLIRLATLSTVHIPGPAALYHPVGPWLVLGRTVPPAFLVTGLWILAFASTAAMVIGLWSRAAVAISCVTAIALASGSYASSATWSHQYNVVFLAHIALLGARCGDTLSADALIRRWRGLPPIDVPHGYQWSLRLVQLAVALMFAGAAFHKLLHAKFTLRWALSDNLRHQLLVRFDLAGLPRPAVASWIIDDVWRYRCAALLNMISQAMPIMACIFVRRPLIRALGGAFFVIETIALGLVVDLWNPQWLPLVAVFVDWDRLLEVVTRRPRALPSTEGWVRPRGVRVFIIAFVVYDALTAFVPRLDQVLRTYPFSGFPMFASVRAREPYSDHLPYSVPGDRFEAVSDRPLDDHAQRWLDHMNRRLYQVSDPAQYKTRLTAILADTKARFPEFGICGLRHDLAIFETPPYPAPAHLEPRPIAEVGEVGCDGTFRSALGKLDDANRITPGASNVDTAGATLELYKDDTATPTPIDAPRQGAHFQLPPVDTDLFYAVAVIGDHRWLVASRHGWRWE